MWSVYFLILVAFLLGLAFWLVFIWSAKSGQYDDPEGPKYRMLEDEEEEEREEKKAEEE